MRILLVTDLYPLENSNEPQTIKEFAKNWISLGHQVDVIRPNFLLNTIIRKKKIFPEKTYFEDGITIYNVNCISPFLFDITKKLPKDFKIYNYNIVISHMPSGALFAFKLVEKCPAIPYAISVHSSDITVLSNPIYGIYFKKKLLKAYKRADCISARSIVLSKKIKELSPFAENKTFIAPSGVKQEIIEPQEFFNEKAFRKPSPFIITTVSKLIKRKNIDIVIKAVARTNIQDIVLKIIGDGEQADYLKKLVKIYNLQDRVVFEGKIPNEEVLLRLRDSDLFTLVSNHETFGMAYLEAAARANIVIATKNDGIDGIIKNGINGFTCNPDVVELTNLIKKVYNLSTEEKSRILINSRNYLIENDDKKVSASYLEEIKKFI